MTREQKSTLAHVLEGFVRTLHTSSDAARRVIAADLVGWTCELGGRRVGGVANLDVVQTLLSSGASCVLHFMRQIADVSFIVLTVPPQFCHDTYCCLLCLTGDFE